MRAGRGFGSRRKRNTVLQEDDFTAKGGRSLSSMVPVHRHFQLDLAAAQARWVRADRRRDRIAMRLRKIQQAPCGQSSRMPAGLRDVTGMLSLRPEKIQLQRFEIFDQIGYVGIAQPE
jgi:hypothetical protein